jgi:hypothetical protein
VLVLVIDSWGISPQTRPSWPSFASVSERRAFDQQWQKTR